MALRKTPIPCPTSTGTGGSSPSHFGALALSFTGATSNSLCSGSASTIAHVLPAITNLATVPSSSSPLSFKVRTKASSTFPMVRLDTASLTRYDCLSGIIDRLLLTHCLVLEAGENQPFSKCLGTGIFTSCSAFGISSSGVLKSGRPSISGRTNPWNVCAPSRLDFPFFCI